MTRTFVYVDFDGVVVDSRPGISEALDATLVAAGLAPVAVDRLDAMIGPPLLSSLIELLLERGVDVGYADELLTAYRARYELTSTTGTVLQPGIAKALARLSLTGTLAIASSKPLRFTEPLVERLGIDHYFAAIVAPTAALDGETKTETLARAIASVEPPGSSTSRIMIGDRRQDMSAARDQQCRAIGALWGYGSASELLESGADALAVAPADLPSLVFGSNA